VFYRFSAKPPVAPPNVSTIHRSAFNPLPLSQLPHTPAAVCSPGSSPKHRCTTQRCLPNSSRRQRYSD